jgi:sigma-E factor negative regulatory protein RseB
MKMNKAHPIAFMALVLLQAGMQYTLAQSSEELINGMMDATRTSNYEGIFVFKRGQDMEVMRILHKNDDSGELEKITALTGYAREFIRNNDTVTCIFPDKEEVMVERSQAQGFAGKITESLELIAEYYDFSTIGQDRVAGRDTWLVRISPKDEHRYGYQMWIDKDSQLLLKSEMLDDEGEVLEMVMFTEIRIHDSIADELFTPSISGAEYTWYQYTQESLDNITPQSQAGGGWQLTWMPAGFRLSVYDGHSLTQKNDPLQHMIYSDGISTVSIFIEKIGADRVIDSGSLRLGAVNVYSKTTNGFQVTAVGEVPQPTVMRMVNSLASGE